MQILSKRLQLKLLAGKVQELIAVPWTYHTAQWGDYTVSVMPRTVITEPWWTLWGLLGGLVQVKVVDSNTGVVMEAPPDQDGMLACTITDDGAPVNCDWAALEQVIGWDQMVDILRRGRFDGTIAVGRYETAMAQLERDRETGESNALSQP